MVHYTQVSQSIRIEVQNMIFTYAIIEKIKVGSAHYIVLFRVSPPKDLNYTECILYHCTQGLQ